MRKARLSFRPREEVHAVRSAGRGPAAGWSGGGAGATFWPHPAQAVAAQGRRRRPGRRRRRARSRSRRGGRPRNWCTSPKASRGAGGQDVVVEDQQPLGLLAVAGLAQRLPGVADLKRLGAGERLEPGVDAPSPRPAGEQPGVLESLAAELPLEAVHHPGDVTDATDEPCVGEEPRPAPGSCAGRAAVGVEDHRARDGPRSSSRRARAAGARAGASSTIGASSLPAETWATMFFEQRRRPGSTCRRGGRGFCRRIAAVSVDLGPRQARTVTDIPHPSRAPSRPSVGLGRPAVKRLRLGPAHG